MEFELKRASEVLRQTPYALSRLLEGLSPEWIQSEGNEADWSPYDVVGHLIHCEETDWIIRVEIILRQEGHRKFEPFDRLAQFRSSQRRTLSDLLTEFAHLRNSNLERMVRWQLTPAMLELTGLHPELGEVTLKQLLATWVVHDLNHIRQIVTYMSRKYLDEVGPWKPYLSILQ
jgi:hypothetical protein